MWRSSVNPTGYSKIILFVAAATTKKNEKKNLSLTTYSAKFYETHNEYCYCLSESQQQYSFERETNIPF